MDTINHKYAFVKDHIAEEKKSALHVRDNILPFLGHLILSDIEYDNHLAELCLEFFSLSSKPKQFSLGYYKFWRSFCAYHYPIDFDDLTIHDYPRVYMNDTVILEIKRLVTPFLKNYLYYYQVFTYIHDYAREVKAYKKNINRLPIMKKRKRISFS